LPQSRYRTTEAQLAAHQQIGDGLRTLPGVTWVVAPSK